MELRVLGGRRDAVCVLFQSDALTEAQTEQCWRTSLNSDTSPLEEITAEQPRFLFGDHWKQRTKARRMGCRGAADPEIVGARG